MNEEGEEEARVLHRGPDGHSLKGDLGYPPFDLANVRHAFARMAWFSSLTPQVSSLRHVLRTGAWRPRAAAVQRAHRLEQASGNELAVAPPSLFGFRVQGSPVRPACYPGKVSDYVGDGNDPAHDLSKEEKDALEAQLRKEIVAHVAARERREASKKKRRCGEVSVSKSRRGHQGREH